MREYALYPPVKAFLEAQGYEVKGEVNGCDLVAVRAEEPPVIVELKTAFSLPLVFQPGFPGLLPVLTSAETSASSTHARINTPAGHAILL